MRPEAGDCFPCATPVAALTQHPGEERTVSMYLVGLVTGMVTVFLLIEVIGYDDLE